MARVNLKPVKDLALNELRITQPRQSHFHGSLVKYMVGV